jgi:hypothetical protein
LVGPSVYGAFRAVLAGVFSVWLIDTFRHSR